MDVNSVCNLLTDLAKNLKEGTICVETVDAFTAVKTGGDMALELELSSKKGKQQVSLALEWKLDSTDEGAGYFKISNQLPETFEPSTAESDEP